MEKQKFLELTDLDKLKHVIKESLKDHKLYNKDQFWKGSAFMGKNILTAIKQIEEHKS